MQSDEPDIPGGVDVSVPDRVTFIAFEHGMQRVTLSANMFQGHGLALGAYSGRSKFGDTYEHQFAQAVESPESAEQCSRDTGHFPFYYGRERSISKAYDSAF